MPRPAALRCRDASRSSLDLSCLPGDVRAQPRRAAQALRVPPEPTSSQRLFADGPLRIEDWALVSDAGACRTWFPCPRPSLIRTWAIIAARPSAPGPMASYACSTAGPG